MIEGDRTEAGASHFMTDTTIQIREWGPELGVMTYLRDA